MINKLMKKQNNPPEVSKIKVLSNAQYFIILKNTTSRQCIDLLKFGVYKLYPYTEYNDIQSILYYDLFENMNKNWNFDT